MPLCRGTTLAQYPLKFSLSENLSGAEEARTPDLLNANQTLSQLSYCPVSAFSFRLSVFSFNLINFNFGWLLKADSWLLKKWAQVDSNHWPQSYQGCALTNWAMGPNAQIFAPACSPRGEAGGRQTENLIANFRETYAHTQLFWYLRWFALNKK